MTGILTPDEAAARLLAARGYSFARRFRHMEIELVAPPETPDPPAGISLLPLDPNGDVRAVHHVLEDAFRDHWDFAPTSFEDFVDRSAGDGGYDPALWIVALDGGHTVGVLTASAHRDRGWINEIGVLRSHRGRGIASALLVTSFAGFWARGLRRVRLNVDSENTSGAVSLYERVGMRTVNSYDLWARTLGS